MNGFTIAEFTAIAGISRQRLNVLWQEGRGPPRIERKAGRRTRITIPHEGGMVWLFHRYPERTKGYIKLVEAVQDEDGLARGAVIDLVLQ